MASNLAFRLQAARHSQFVGRTDELALFRSALVSQIPPFHLLYVYGPAGIGKTTLLREFALAAQQARRQVYYLDARNVEASPDAFAAALIAATGLMQQPAPEPTFGVRALPGPDGSPEGALAVPDEPAVILIDTFENLRPLDNWLRETFLPHLPDNALVVLAGREPPTDEWQADAGWQSLARVLQLRNLSPDETRDYLTRRGIPGPQHQKILDFTHGHALALSLVADLFAQRHSLQFEPEAAPDVIQVLLERFVRKVPGPAHRAALEACALVRAMTEALLQEMFWPSGQGAADSNVTEGAHELFEWLRGLSFIESGRDGIFPHDLARETLVADLRWRNPDWYKELHRRARNYYASRLQAAPRAEQERLLLDYVFLHRDNPVIRPMLEWQASGSVLPDTLREPDRVSLVAMVAEHEGKDSARIAARWLERQASGVTVYRDAGGEPVGFLATVALEQAQPQDLRSDPGARAAQQYLERHAPLRHGESAAIFRFWMARDTYQAVSAVQTVIFLSMVRHYLTSPRLAFHFLPVADPALWASAFAYANLARLEEADFIVDGRRFGVYGHDWRTEPPLAWLAMLAEREVGGEPPPAHPTLQPLVLSRAEFGQAVQDALKGYIRPGGLQRNPLLRSRLVTDCVNQNAGEEERACVLQDLIRQAAESLEASPREAKLYRALYRTFIKPEPTQEKAAEALDLPFSTYRRHLKAGIEQVTDLLWRREIGDLEKRDEDT